MPNSVLEAMACGLPVLVSRSAGSDSIVEDGQTGSTVDLDDENTFSEKLFQLTHDAALRKMLGGNGRRVVEARYSLRTIASQYVSLYEDLLNAGDGPMPQM